MPPRDVGIPETTDIFHKRRQVLIITLSLLAVLFSAVVFPIPAWTATTIYVNGTTGSDITGDGSAGNPYQTITKGLSVAGSGDTVSAAAGDYHEKVNLVNGVTLQGAGAGVTTINGDGSGSVVSANGVTGVTVDGFTITNGSATHGGGLHFYNASGTISNNIIVNNSTTGGGGGGGIRTFSNVGPQFVSIINNTIRNNSSSYWGSGVLIQWNSGGVVRGNIIYQNSSPTAATVHVDGGYPGVTIEKNVIRNNTDHGILFATASGLATGTIDNNIVVNNGYIGIVFAQAAGGVVTAKAFNNTIYGNQGDGSRGGLFAYTSSPPNPSKMTLALFNNTIWGNNLKDLEWSSVNATSSYSDIGTGFTAGTGNISVDPKFVNPAANDFHLASDSPAIDAGTSIDAPATDFEGDPRPVDGDSNGSPGFDMGADEFVPPVPTGANLLFIFGVANLLIIIGTLLIWQRRKLLAKL